MRYVSIILMFVTMSGTTMAQQDMFLLIGQSNMAGRAPIEDIDTTTLKSVFLFNDKGEFEPAKNPLNRYSTIMKAKEPNKLGPGYTFARTVQSFYEDTVLLVVNARGGTALELWLKQAPEGYYNEAIKRVKLAQQAKPDAVLRAIIWHQGESNDDNYANHLARLKQMVADYRADLGMPGLPFIAGDVGQWNKGYREISKILKQIPDHIPNSYVVSSAGLTHVDSEHFDSRSQRSLGRRYAAKYIESQTARTVHLKDTVVCQNEMISGKDITGDYWLSKDADLSFLALDINADSTFLDITLCEGKSMNGYSNSGHYRWIAQSVFGCDSLIDLVLKVSPVDTVVVDTTLLDVNSFYGYTQTGTYWRKYSSKLMCDSVVQFKLTFTKTVTTGVSDDPTELPPQTVIIYDFTGRVLYQGDPDRQPTLPAGLYVLRYIADRRSWTRKIMMNSR